MSERELSKMPAPEKIAGVGVEGKLRVFATHAADLGAILGIQNGLQHHQVVVLFFLFNLKYLSHTWQYSAGTSGFEPSNHAWQIMGSIWSARD